MKKILTLMFALILALSATAFANDKATEVPPLTGERPQLMALYNGQTYYVVNCKQSITLRNAPSVYADEITQIPLGAAVTFLNNVGNGFFRINYDGLIGFALASYLAPAGY